VDDLEYNYDKADQRAEKLDRHLADAMTKLHSYDDTIIPVEGGKGVAGVAKHRVNNCLWLVQQPLQSLVILNTL